MCYSCILEMRFPQIFTCLLIIICLVWFMVFNTTFNNISVMLWWSVLLVEESGENHRPVTSHWHTLSHKVVSSTPCPSGIRTHNMIGNDYTGICKSNYHMIMTMMATLNTIWRLAHHYCSWVGPFFEWVIALFHFDYFIKSLYVELQNNWT